MGFCRERVFAGFELNFTIPSSFVLIMIHRTENFLHYRYQRRRICRRRKLLSLSLAELNRFIGCELSHEFRQLCKETVERSTMVKGKGEFYGNFQLDMRVLLLKHSEVNDDELRRVGARDVNFQNRNM
jgi:hypothetical protein